MIDGIEPENDDNVKRSPRISRIAVSPKETYIVTYSKDDKSILGWNIDKDEEIKEDPHPLKVKNNVYGMKVLDNKVLMCQYKLHVSIYKLGEEKPIKIKFNKSGTIDFTRNEKLVNCRPKENKILIYSINNNKLELESVYKINFDDVRKCGITEKEIWAMSSRYLYFWNLKTLEESDHSLCFLGAYDHQPERYYSFVNYVDSSIYLSINKNLILIGDDEQYVIFSRKVDNTPIRCIKHENFKGLPNFVNNNYFLVHSVEKGNRKILLYNIFDEKQPVDVTKSFKFRIYDYNLQTNKVYGVDDNNNIIIEDFSDRDWEKYFKYGKDHDHNVKKVITDASGEKDEDNILSGWNNYFTIINPDMERTNYEDDNMLFGWKNYFTIINPDTESIRSLLQNDIVNLSNNDDVTKINFHNHLYGWKIYFKSLKDMRIEIIKTPEKNQDSNEKCICFKDIHHDSYEPMKCILLK